MNEPSLNPSDYYVCFKWIAVFDYTQTPRRSSGRTKPRIKTAVSLEVLGSDAWMAEYELQAWIKKRRGATLDRIVSLTAERVSWAYLRTPPDYPFAPREIFHIFPLPDPVLSTKTTVQP